MRRKNSQPQNDSLGSVHVVAASSPVKPSLLRSGEKLLEQSGWRVLGHRGNREKDRYFAGSEKSRADRLGKALSSKESEFVWCARGGYGMAALLAHLEKRGLADLLKKERKMVLGFSDVTALHLWIHKRTGLPSLHCPMPATPSWQKLSKAQRQRIFSYMQGSAPLGEDSFSARWKLRPLRPFSQSVSGILIGGNLTLVVSSLGTPWEPSWKGKILFLEDCGESPYRVDRMLLQLDQAGVLAQLSGIVLGDFEADVVYKTRAERGFWKPMFEERLGHLPYPVLLGAPVGHGKRNEPLPLGVRYSLTRSGRMLLEEWPWSKAR